MSKAKFDAARELIREGQYTQARILLESIDHPQAKEWLIKLHDLEVNAIRTVGVASSKIKVSVEKPKRNKLRGCMVMIVAVLVLAAIGSALPRTPKAADATNVPTITPGGPTATITNTPAPTATATITETPLPTVTMTIEEQMAALETQVREIARAKGVTLLMASAMPIGSPKVVALSFEMAQDFSGYSLEATGREMLVVACALYAGGFNEDWNYTMQGMVDTIDRSTGKTDTQHGLSIRVLSQRVGTWDCANAELMDAEQAMDEYIVDPIMTR